MVVEIFVVSPACSLKNVFVTSVRVVDTVCRESKLLNLDVVTFQFLLGCT